MPDLRTFKTEKLRRLYQRYPDAYASDVLKASLTDDQAEMLVSLVEYRRTCVKASHAIGKTFLAAVSANWWYDCWDEHICYITAPTWPQALGLTFKEIKRSRRALDLPGEILDTGLVRDKDPLRAASHFIRALNSASGEGFQGEHSAPILIILEESVGVPHYIWEAADGLMTHPECRLLAIANPTDETTDFGLACASPNYHTITVSALQHPNILAELAGKPALYPKAVRLAWLEEMLQKECEPVEDSTGDAFEFPAGSGSFYLPNAIFQGRVLGEFPTQADQQVIPRGWLLGAKPHDPEGAVEIGCDVARFGDDRTTICVRQGHSILAMREIRKMDGDFVAAALMEAAQEVAGGLIEPETENCAALVQSAARTIPIKLDVTGGLGVAPAILLRAQGYNVVEVNASKSAADSNYPNIRSELWFNLRDFARNKELDFSRLPRPMQDNLVRELSTPKWASDSKGRKVVETKADIKKRLGASPDLADAVCLAFYANPQTFITSVRRGRSY